MKGSHSSGPRRLDAAIKQRLSEALKESHGKIYGPGGAAELLGLKPSTLQAKLKKYRLNRKSIGS